MSLKPKYVFFYSSDDAVKGLMNQSPFNWDKPIHFHESKDNARIEYEHFDVRCYRAEYGIGDKFRGIRAWNVLIEDCLYDTLNLEDINHRLLPIMYPFDKLGGKITSISIYRGEIKNLVYDEDKEELIEK